MKKTILWPRIVPFALACGAAWTAVISASCAGFYAVMWTNKGLDLADRGHWEEALTCYDRAIELDPRDVAAWNNKGLALGALGRWKEALTCSEKAVEINPRLAEV